MSLFGISRINRRTVLSALAAAPALATSAKRAGADTIPSNEKPGSGTSPALAPRPACTLTPASVSGPFYFDPKLQRADITEGYPGAPLRLRFVVMDASNCTPMVGARVDVWQTRADGYYSGYPGQGDKRNVDTSGTTFLRGTQIADVRGVATFQSIYPGWYLGRTVHVHFKIIIEAKDLLTGQMYFPDALSQYIFANVGVYRRKAVRNTFNGDDELALSDTTRGGFCDIKEEADHYLATLVVAVNRAAATVMDDSPTPPSQPRAIVPGIAPAKQKNG